MWLHGRGGLEIGDRASHAGGPVKPPQRESELPAPQLEERPEAGLDSRAIVEAVGRELRVRATLTLELRGPGGGHPSSDRGRPFGAAVVRAVRRRIEMDDKVEPVAHRAGEPSLVASAGPVLAPALAPGDGKPAAGARVVRGDQHEASGQGEHPLGAGDGDRPRVDRAPQGVEGIGTELERLVQEERTPVGQAGFAGSDAWAAADQGLGRDRVVRGAEGAAPARHGIGHARDRVDAAHLRRLRLAEWWEEARAGAGEQRLAHARRPAERQVVAPGDGDLERPAANSLADHRREIGRIVIG